MEPTASSIQTNDPVKLFMNHKTRGGANRNIFAHISPGTNGNVTRINDNWKSPIYSNSTEILSQQIREINSLDREHSNKMTAVYHAVRFSYRHISQTFISCNKKGKALQSGWLRSGERRKREAGEEVNPKDCTALWGITRNCSRSWKVENCGYRIWNLMLSQETFGS